MDVVVLHRIVPGKGQLEILIPADDDSAVGRVVDQVVGNDRVLRHAQEDPDRAEVGHAAVVDVIVRDPVALAVAFGGRRVPFQCRAVPDPARADSTRAEIANLISVDHNVRGAFEKAQSHAADMRDTTVGEAARSGVLERDRRVHPFVDGLVAFCDDEASEDAVESRRRKRPVDMLDADSLEVQIPHWLCSGAGHGQERLLDHWRHRLDAVYLFARPGPIGENARMPVQEPLAGLIQQLPRVLEVARFPGQGDADAPIALEDPGYRLLGRRNRERLCRFVHAAHAPPPHLVVVHEHQLDIGSVLPGFDRMVHAHRDRGVPGRRLLLRRGGLDVPPSGFWIGAIGCSGTDRASAVDEQLMEVPPAGLHVRLGSRRCTSPA